MRTVADSLLFSDRYFLPASTSTRCRTHLVLWGLDGTGVHSAVPYQAPIRDLAPRRASASNIMEELIAGFESLSTSGSSLPLNRRAHRLWPFSPAAYQEAQNAAAYGKVCVLPFIRFEAVDELKLTHGAFFFCRSPCFSANKGRRGAGRTRDRGPPGRPRQDQQVQPPSPARTSLGSGYEDEDCEGYTDPIAHSSFSCLPVLFLSPTERERRA